MRAPLMLVIVWLTILLCAGCSTTPPAEPQCDCAKQLEAYRRAVITLYDELQVSNIENLANFRRLGELEGAVEDHNGRLLFIEQRVDQPLKELRYVGEDE